MRTVSKIVVTELESDRDNPEPYLVEWVINHHTYRHQHDSKKAAQRHVGNLLKDTGLSRDQVLTVNYRGQ